MKMTDRDRIQASENVTTGEAQWLELFRRLPIEKQNAQLEKLSAYVEWLEENVPETC